MLQDKIRTEAYRDVIYKNRNIITGKTVADVGAGMYQIWLEKFTVL